MVCMGYASWPYFVIYFELWFLKQYCTCHFLESNFNCIVRNFEMLAKKQLVIHNCVLVIPTIIIGHSWLRISNCRHLDWPYSGVLWTLSHIYRTFLLKCLRVFNCYFFAKKFYRNCFIGSLTLSRHRSLSYRNKFTDLPCILLDWFLHDRDPRHERINTPLW